MNTTGLLPFQVEHTASAWRILQARRVLLDASDTGTGKTAVALALCRELGVTPLVVAPLGVKQSWEAMGRHLGVDVCHVNYERARGARKRDNDGVQMCARTEWGRERPHGKGSSWEWAQAFDTIIFDEVHRCAGSTTLASKLLIAAKRQCGRVICLSATAAVLPGQMKALGYALGLHNLAQYHTWLLQHRYVPSIWGASLEPPKSKEDQEWAMAKLHDALFPNRAVRLRKADIPGFPRTYVRAMPMDPEGAVELAEELRQLYASHPESLEELQRLRAALEDLRTPQTLSLIEDAVLTSKVAVFVNFVKSVWDLYDGGRRRGLRVGAITGDRSAMNGEDCLRHDVVAAFQANQLDLLAVTYGAGGESISLHDPAGVQERTAYLYPTWSLRQFAQGLGRVHRANGAFSRQFLCYFEGTYEERVAEILERRWDNLELLNDGVLNGLFAGHVR